MAEHSRPHLHFIVIVSRCDFFSFTISLLCVSACLSSFFLNSVVFCWSWASSSFCVLCSFRRHAHNNKQANPHVLYMKSSKNMGQRNASRGHGVFFFFLSPLRENHKQNRIVFFLYRFFRLFRSLRLFQFKQHYNWWFSIFYGFIAWTEKNGQLYLLTAPKWWARGKTNKHWNANNKKSEKNIETTKKSNESKFQRAFLTKSKSM